MRNKRKLHSTARHRQLLAGTVVCGTVGQSLSLPGQTEGAGHCLLLSWAVKCIGRHKCACSESWGAQHREDEFSLPHCLVPELFGTATRYQSLSGALKSYFQAIPCTTATASSLLGFTDKPFHFYAVACHQNTAGNGCVCMQTDMHSLSMGSKISSFPSCCGHSVRSHSPEGVILQGDLVAV